MKHTQIVRIALWTIGGVAAAWIGIRFLLPLFLPFLIGLAAARLAQGPVRFLRERAGLPGWLAAGLVVLGLYGLLGFGIYWLCRAACGELARFTKELPALLQSMSAPLARLRAWLDSLAARAPALLRDAVRESVDSFFSSGRIVAQKAYSGLFSLASGAVAALPDLVLFLVTTVLSSVMLASRYDALRALARRRMPRPWRERMDQALTGLRGTLAVWVKAQLKLGGINFLLLTAGLMLLGTAFPLLLGALIALIDALPVFGAGVILIPWGVLSFARGDSRLGAGLLLLYAAAYLTRTTLEPRLVGRQVGLSPLLTLLSLYTGYKLLGVAGMLVFPLGAVLLKQLWDHAAPAEWRAGGGGAPEGGRKEKSS